MEQLEYRTAEQHKVLFGLLHRLNWLHYRQDLAIQYSNGRTESTKELYFKECQTLINYLKIEVNKPQGSKEPTQLEKMRKKFFYYCHELKWKKKGKLDYERINNWLLKFSYLKKPLNNYKNKLLQQIENVLKKQK